MAVASVMLGLSAMLTIAEDKAPASRPAGGMIASEPTTSTSRATDWPQWRGPDRNGIARQSPALLDEFPKEGPKKIWESEDVITDGCGSISVSGGKVYVHEHCVERHVWQVTKLALERQGYCPGMPPDLSRKVEEARLGKDRAAKTNNWTTLQWIDEWLRTNLAREQSKYEGAIRYRLLRGAEALPLDVLDKLVPIVDKKFARQEDWFKWVEGSGLDADAQASIRSLARPEEVYEYLYCLDAANGKRLWKTAMSTEQHWAYPSSSTPTVLAGKIFLLDSACTICCFDADNGKLLWESDSFIKQGHDQGRYSSVLVGQKSAVFVTSKGVSAVSPVDGKTMWTVPGTGACSAGSAAAWAGGPKPYVLVEFDQQLRMLAQETGDVIASAKGGGNSTPVIVGDVAVACGNDSLRAYKLSSTNIECLWTVPFKDDYTMPVTDGKYVYAVGGGNHYVEGRGNWDGKAMCVELQTGKVMWDEVMSRAEYTSPVLVDGKIVVVVDPELVMFKASPDKFQLVGRANLGLTKWVSPAIADGKVFLRTAKRVVCYDLGKH
jgi:outer membrane protein assembly factor BamB